MTVTVVDGAPETHPVSMYPFSRYSLARLFPVISQGMNKNPRTSRNFLKR